MTKSGRSYWIPGSYAPPWSEKRTSVLKAIEKEGLQEGTGDNNWVVRHRHIYDPGIQQERQPKPGPARVVFPPHPIRVTRAARDVRRWSLRDTIWELVGLQQA